MDLFDRIIGGFVTLLFAAMIFFMGVKAKEIGEPNNLYMVYLNGEKIGLIKDKEKLLELIDREQEEIKDKYNVDKVYPPNGLDIQSVVTYDDKVISVSDIYNTIKEKSSFTISGYKAVINYDDSEIESEDKVIYMLNKEDFETALYNTAKAFIGSEELDKYNTGTKVEIEDVGSKVENVYFSENIEVSSEYINVNETIYTNSEDLSKYLLFGTTEASKKYTVRDGDSVKTISENNNLNVNEFLIANPEVNSANALLGIGQVVNTTLIDPIVSIVYEVEKIEDVEVPYEIEYQVDDTKYVGDNEVLQEGSNGQMRVTEMIKYINGEIKSLVITSKNELVPTVKKVIRKGTKTMSTGIVDGGFVYQGTNTYWRWPTAVPYVITSYYGWRWGKLHAGIDISGCGFGSPIYSVGDGIVTKISSGCSNNGFYGSTCGNGFGNAVWVSYGNGIVIVYAHITSNIPVVLGQTLSSGEVVGYMGNSGSSTGTHLHFGVFFDDKSVDPCTSGVISC